jgi:hypothetical protein
MSRVASEGLGFKVGVLLNLFSKDELNRMVSGALRDCIKMPGPITSQGIDSASKRVTGTILDRLVRFGKQACADAGLRIEVQRLTSELAECRKQKVKLQKDRHDLLALLKKHNISPGDVGSEFDVA